MSTPRTDKVYTPRTNKVLDITQEGSGTPEVNREDSSLPGEVSLAGESREGCRQVSTPRTDKVLDITQEGSGTQPHPGGLNLLSSW